MKRICILLMAVIIGVLSVLTFIGHGKQTAQSVGSQDLLRLHVIANSNSPDDQHLKYLVRDQVIAYLQPQLQKVSTKRQAYEWTIAQADVLRQVALDVVQQQGYDYPVSVQIGRFPFPLKLYGDLVVPEGEYDAVKITIGQGEGANWWCVLFPPLCLVDGSVAASQAQAGSVEFRFKILDWLNSTK